MKNNQQYSYSICSIKGIKLINEDDAWVGFNHSGQCLAIVCDGISSEKGSELASKTIVDYFQQEFEKTHKVIWFNSWVKSHLNKAYNILKEKALEEHVSVGTTLVLAIISNKKAHIFNIGDSRLYHVSTEFQNVEQITRDHNLYNHLEHLNAPQAVFIKNKKNLLALTRYIDSSTKENMNFDYYKIKAKKGDMFFLATDGLYNYIDVQHIYNRTSYLTEEQFSELARTLCNEALQNRSNDNITGILVKVNK